MSDSIVNGINVDNLRKMVQEISENKRDSDVHFEVSTKWAGGTSSKTHVNKWRLGKQELSKDFTILIDEPEELLGRNTAPNPQEMLMAAFNACMIVGYVAGCSVRGIKIEHLEIRTEGMLDLRGFLGLDKSVKPGYEELSYVVSIKGNGSAEDFQEIHENVISTSPNRWNIANKIKLNGSLSIVE